MQAIQAAGGHIRLLGDGRGVAARWRPPADGSGIPSRDAAARRAPLAPLPTTERGPTLAAHRERRFGRSLSSLISGLPMLLLTTTGRRSGLPRTVALAYTRIGEDLLVVGGDHGADRQPQWYRNLCRDPEVLVELGRARFAARAIPLEGP